jgi:hypothetical protein
MHFGFPVFKGDMADSLFVDQTSRRTKVIAEFAVNDGQSATQTVSEKRFARAVRTQHSPVLIRAEVPGSVRENQAVSEPKGGVLQGEKWPCVA